MDYKMDRDLEIVKEIQEQLDDLAKIVPEHEDSIFSIQNKIIDLINVLPILDED